MKNNNQQMNNSHYDESQIQVLEGLDAVRRRPGMYIGSTGPQGLHHLVFEVVDNSIDEAMAGHCQNISVSIGEDSRVTVSEDGRGIPVGEHPQMKIPAVEVVLTILHSGGKFGGEGYKVSGGLHGVGVSVVNALSEWLEAEVKRDGQAYLMRFARGKPVTSLQVLGTAQDTGTKITFRPDEEIFETLDYQYDILAQRLRELAFLNKGVSISLTDRRPGREQRETFKFEGGIRSFVEYLSKNKETLHKKPIFLEQDKQDCCRMEIAMQYNDGYNEVLSSYANNIRTKEGGTHEFGFKAALTRLLNDYARKQTLLKDNESNLSGDDVREGLVAVISVRLLEPQFEGQTKTKLGNSEMRGHVESFVYEELGVFFEQNPSVAKKIIE